MLGDSTVVVVAPVGGVRMLAVGRVMSRMRRSRVIRNGVEIVDRFRTREGGRGRRPVGGFGGEIGKIERVREIDKRREFGAKRAAGEPLEMEDEDARELLNGEGFGAAAALLAAAAFRPLVAVEDLLLREEGHAGVQRRRTAAPAERLWQRQRQVPKGIEGDGSVTASRALERRLELTDENLADPRILVSQISLPTQGSLFQVGKFVLFLVIDDDWLWL